MISAYLGRRLVTLVHWGLMPFFLLYWLLTCFAPHLLYNFVIFLCDWYLWEFCLIAIIGEVWPNIPGLLWGYVTWQDRGKGLCTLLDNGWAGSKPQELPHRLLGTRLQQQLIPKQEQWIPGLLILSCNH